MESKADFFEEARAATLRLLAVAQRDTGQSARCANFLLAWWNAECNGGFSLTDLWMMDRALQDDMLTVFIFVMENQHYPTVFGLGKAFENLVEQWRMPSQIGETP